MASLTVVEGPGQGEQVTLGERTTAGRSRDCDLRIRDEVSSRVHFEIISTPQGHILKDLDSSNGTFVNGQIITEHRLRDGDRIGVAGVTLHFSQADRVDPAELMAEPADVTPSPEARPARSLPNVPGYRIKQPLRGDDLCERFLATEVAMERPVAVELLAQPRGSTPAAAAQRLRAAAQLEHPAFAHIYAVTEASGRVVAARETTAGLSMWELAGKMTPDTALEVATTVAEAMAEAHAARLVHGSLRPDRIVRTNAGHLKLLGIGLPAPATEALSEAPDLQQRPSRVAYMAPEQLKGHVADEASDIYALGASLYHMLTGRTPIPATSEAALKARLETETPLPVRSLVEKVPRGFAELIDRMLARHPAQRPESMAAVAEQLKALARRSAPGVGAPGMRTEAEAQGLSASTIIIIILTVLLLISGFIIGRLSGKRFIGQPPPAREASEAENRR